MSEHHFNVSLFDPQSWGQGSKMDQNFMNPGSKSESLDFSATKKSFVAKCKIQNNFCKTNAKKPTLNNCEATSEKSFQRLYSINSNQDDV